MGGQSTRCPRGQVGDTGAFHTVSIACATGIIRARFPTGDGIRAGVQSAATFPLLRTTVPHTIAGHARKDTVFAQGWCTDRVGSVAFAPSAPVAESRVFAGSWGIFRAIIVGVGPQLDVRAGTILAVALERCGTGLADPLTSCIAANAIDTEAREAVVLAGTRRAHRPGFDTLTSYAVKASLRHAVEAGGTGSLAPRVAADVRKAGRGRGRGNAGTESITQGRIVLGGGIEAGSESTREPRIGRTGACAVTKARGLTGS